MCLVVFGFLLYGNAGYSQKITKQEEGYFNITEAGAHLGLSASYPDHPGYPAPGGGGIRTINGIFLSPGWSLGIGVGTDWYNSSHDEGLFTQYNHVLPVFLDARYYIRESRNTPFIYTDIGYSVNLFDSFDKGLTLSLGGGHKFFAGASTCLVASLGYNLQQIDVDPEAASGNVNLHSASLRLGFLF